MINFADFSDNLELKSDGIWYAKNQAEISYPDEGNADCMQLEDDSFWFQHRNNCITALVSRFSKDKVFYDIGGGNGYVANGLERAKISTVLVEPGESGVRNAKLRGLTNVVCATTETSGFKKNSIDAIGLFDVVEHIDDDKNFIRQNHDFLKKDGLIYITVPAFNFLWSTDDDYAGHFRRHTIGSMSELLKKSGFEIVYGTYLFSVLPLPIFLLRSIPSKFGVRKETKSIDTYKKEHSKKSSGGILQKIWNWELSKVKNLEKIKFGSSVLVVGRKI